MSKHEGITAATRKQGFSASVDGKLLYLKCSSSQEVQGLKTLPAGSCQTLTSLDNAKDI